MLKMCLNLTLEKLQEPWRARVNVESESLQRTNETDTDDVTSRLTFWAQMKQLVLAVGTKHKP